MTTQTRLVEEKLDQLLAKVGTLERNVAAIAERQRVQAELIDELLPIAKLAMRAGSEKLEVLEQRGYFAFAAAAGSVVDRIVTGFTPADVEQLGDNVVQILGTIRRMTQPAILAVADEATGAIEEAKDAQPLGWSGMFKASHDDDVQRGLATAVAVLRRLGQLSKEASGVKRAGTAKLERLLGPTTRRSDPARLPAPAGAAPVTSARGAPDGHEASPPATLDGVAFDREGFLTDPSAWTPQLASELAASLGISLTPAHWVVIEFARAEYQATQKSPNVRRLSTGSGIAVKELYALFPGAPGKKAARIAGVPKPAGCI